MSHVSTFPKESGASLRCNDVTMFSGVLPECSEVLADVGAVLADAVQLPGLALV